MEDVSFNIVNSADATVPDGEARSPFAQEKVLLTKAEHIRLKWEANYWKSQHERAVGREASLAKQVEHWKAKVRDLQHRLYGKKGEKSSKADPRDKPKSKGKRGQQQGSAGHGRTDRSGLPIKEEERDLGDDEKCCKRCGKPFEEFPDTEDSEIFEVEVKAHVRKIKRKKYKKGCHCEGTPGIITATPAPRLISKGR